MKIRKRAGVWMDHSNAFFMELTNDIIIQNNIVSEFTHDEKEFSLSKSENLMHNKEQQTQSSYYKKLSSSLKKYNEVVLFGPTNAKNELLNLLKSDHLFENIKIEVKHSDKMTEPQMHSFVREYFNK